MSKYRTRNFDMFYRFFPFETANLTQKANIEYRKTDFKVVFHFRGSIFVIRYSIFAF